MDSQEINVLFVYDTCKELDTFVTDVIFAHDKDNTLKVHISKASLPIIYKITAIDGCVNLNNFVLSILQSLQSTFKLIQPLGNKNLEKELSYHLQYLNKLTQLDNEILNISANLEEIDKYRSSHIIKLSSQEINDGLSVLSNLKLQSDKNGIDFKNIFESTSSLIDSILISYSDATQILTFETISEKVSDNYKNIAKIIKEETEIIQ